MHGYSSTCLVDPGPVLTFIPPDCPGLQHTTVSTYTHTPLLTAGGTPLVTSGMCTLSVQIGNNTVSHEFVVVNNLSTGPLLGADFLNLYSANVPMWEHTRYGEFSLVWRCQRAYFCSACEVKVLMGLEHQNFRSCV